MKNRKIFLLFLFVFNIVNLAASNAQIGTWKTYGRKDSLPADYIKIFNVHIDRKGNSWLITDKGVSMFDGNSWKSFNSGNGLIGNNISASYLDSKGNLWIGCYNNEFGDGGVSVFDGNLWKQYRKSEKVFNAPHIRFIFEDSRNRIWFANATESTAYVAGMSATMSAVVPFAGLAFAIVNAAVQHGGLTMLENGEWINFNNTEQKPPFKFIRKAIEDSKGRIWFYTDKNKLFRYDASNFLVPDEREGYTPGDINDVMEDSKKNIWIASWDRILRYDGSSWTTYGRKEGIIKGLGHFWTLSVLESSQGHIVAPGMTGVCAFDGSSWKKFEYEHVGPYSKHDLETFQSMADSEGNVWVYYNGNFGYYNGKDWKQEKKKVDSKFYIDRNKRVWLPGKNGLEVLIDGVWIYKKEYQDIFGFVEDKKGNIWVGMTNKGVLFYDGSSWNVLKAPGQIPSTIVSNIFVDAKGSVWFATNKGLCCFQYSE